MSNLSIFNHSHITRLVESFAPGMAPHITPIKYEALTPDLFLLLFRTTGQDGQDHFFVSLEFDHIDGLDGARCMIEDWHGSFTGFWPLASADKERNEDIETFQVPTDGPYYAMLAEVPHPTFKGYWSRAVTIMPGDVIGDKIAHFNEHDRQNIYTSLRNILKHDTDADLPFAETFQKSKTDTVVDDINMTNLAVSIYVQPDGHIEYFYNRVKKPKK